MKHLKPFNRLNETTHYDELSLTIITIQQRLLEKYKLEDKVSLTYFTEVLQKSIEGLSHEGKEILLPILRQLKLNTIL